MSPLPAPPPSRTPPSVIAEEILSVLLRRRAECLSQLAAELVLPPDLVLQVLRQMATEGLVLREVRSGENPNDDLAVARSRWALNGARPRGGPAPEPEQALGDRLRDHIRIDRLVARVMAKLI